MDRLIATTLIEIGAVSLRVNPPFTWASGRLSPIYCDNRLLMSFPDRRKQVTAAFQKLIGQKGWSPELIAGTATAGIPHAAWLADALNLPMVYVRGAAKKHGKENQIEGRLAQGQKTVLIEDLISTGGSSVEAALSLREAGAELLGVAAIFTYGLDKATTRFNDAKIDFATLTSFQVLAEQAIKAGSLLKEHKAILDEWQRDPASWSLTRGGAA
jgi:orotate phosphoribosyltransferase